MGPSASIGPFPANFFKDLVWPGPDFGRPGRARGGKLRSRRIKDRVELSGSALAIRPRPIGDF